MAKLTNEKNFWIMLIFLLAGIVIGGLLGELATKVNFLWWLGFGEEFGVDSPIIIDLKIIKFTFAFMIKINIASIIGIALSLLLYKKV